MKRSIYLQLTDSEIKTLKSIILDSESENLKTSFSLLLEEENEDEYIRNNVYRILSDISGLDSDTFNDESDLKKDLGLSLYHKRSLKNYFQKIINELNSENKVTIKECENLTVVVDCLNLIKEKI